MNVAKSLKQGAFPRARLILRPKYCWFKLFQLVLLIYKETHKPELNHAQKLYLFTKKLNTTH